MIEKIPIKLTISQDHLPKKAGIDRLDKTLFRELINKGLLERELENGEPEWPMWVLDVKKAILAGYHVVDPQGTTIGLSTRVPGKFVAYNFRKTKRFDSISEMEAWVDQGGLLEF